MKRLSNKLITVMLMFVLLTAMIPAPVQAASKTVFPGKVTTTQAVSTKCNAITIKWKPSSKKNLDGYYIFYRKSTSKGWSKWIRINTLVNKNKTTFTHVSSKKYPLEGGIRYQYAVLGYNKRCKTYSKYTLKATNTRKHNYAVISKTAATCAKEGRTVSKCRMCGRTQTQTIKKTFNHDWVYERGGSNTHKHFYYPDSLAYHWIEESLYYGRECARCGKYESTTEAEWEKHKNDPRSKDLYHYYPNGYCFAWEE